MTRELPADLVPLTQGDPGADAAGLLMKHLAAAWDAGYDYSVSVDEPSAADNPWSTPCEAQGCDQAAEYGSRICPAHRRQFERLLSPPA